MKIRQVARNLDNDFAAVMGFFGVITGIRAVLDPSVYPVHAVMHGLDTVWAVVFLIGGAALLVGMGLAKPRIEAAGCALFAAGAVMEAIAFGAFLGWTRTSSWVTVAVLLIFATGAYRRYFHLIRGDRQMWVRAGDA